MIDRILIYHGSCDDGFGAAFLFWKLFGDTIEYFPAYYDGKVPDVKDKDVYIVDYSYNKETMEQIRDSCKHFTLLDHHKTAFENLAEFDPQNKGLVLLDNDKSGARLAFDFLSLEDSAREKLAPYEAFINYIQDNDLWQFKLSDSKAFSVGLRSYKQDFTIWNELNIESLLSEGKVILRYYNQKVKELYKSAYEKEVFGHKIKIVNAAGMFASDLGHELAKDMPFGMTWYYDGLSKKFVFSLRSNDTGIDVSLLAKTVGGGGHRNAAGFKLNADEVDKILDLE